LKNSSDKKDPEEGNHFNENNAHAVNNIVNENGMINLSISINVKKIIC